MATGEPLTFLYNLIHDKLLSGSVAETLTTTLFGYATEPVGLTEFIVTVGPVYPAAVNVLETVALLKAPLLAVIFQVVVPLHLLADKFKTRELAPSFAVNQPVERLPPLKG